MQNIKGNVAFITGGSKGIGYGIAAHLLAEGVNVVVTSRSQESADTAAKELNKNSTTEAKAIGLQADVRH
jgi:NAD(P)-dependent dehydrogenase (short-subunit alcohol dehydrogenase family)